eukprot:11032336-Alexandrium_andersonii.AAC.1
MDTLMSAETKVYHPQDFHEWEIQALQPGVVAALAAYKFDKEEREEERRLERTRGGKKQKEQDEEMPEAEETNETETSTEKKGGNLRELQHNNDNKKEEAWK